MLTCELCVISWLLLLESRIGDNIIILNTLCFILIFQVEIANTYILRFHFEDFVLDCVILGKEMTTWRLWDSYYYFTKKLSKVKLGIILKNLIFILVFLVNSLGYKINYKKIDKIAVNLRLSLSTLSSPGEATKDFAPLWTLCLFSYLYYIVLAF